MRLNLKSYFLPSLFLGILTSCVSLENSSQLETQRPLMEDIKKAYKTFANKEGENFFEDGSVKYLSIKGDGISRHFYGVHKDKLTDSFPYSKFKAEIRKKMGINAKKLFQIIGSVNPPFEPKGGEYARQWFYDKIKDADIIEYGVTSGGKIEEPTVNAFVSYGMEQGKIDSSKVLGNVVGDSVYVAEKYNANFSPKIQHLVLVYNETSPERDVNGDYPKERTIFGDDVNISDRIMNKEDGDEMILVDGGVQSLQQAVTALRSGVKVTSIYGIKFSKEYLSAAEFLAGLKARLEETNNWTIQTAKDYYAEYLTTRKGWNPEAHDAYTKQVLLDRIQAELFEKEPLNNLLSLFDSIDYEKIQK
jgi:hypothetical protein